MHISRRWARGWPVKHIGRIIGAALMAAVVGACSGQVELGDLGEAAGGDSEAAAGMVDRWFELARSGQEDFGWWLLHPNTRTDFVGSIEVYREAMASVDWWCHEARDPAVRRRRDPRHPGAAAGTLMRPMCFRARGPLAAVSEDRASVARA